MTEELRVIITAEIAQLRRELDNARREVDSFSDKSVAALSEFNAAIQKVGAVTKRALRTVAISVAGVATAFLGLGVGTKEYRQEQAKLLTAFEAAGASAEDAKKTYNDLYRVLGDTDTAVEAANHLAKLTTNQKDLQEWTTICQGVYATFGASLPIESLTEAANETAQTGEITGALADALNWAGKSEEEFTEALFWCNSAAEREQLIRSTLNDIYGEAAEKYETAAAGVIAQNEAQARLSDAMAELGEAAQPILTLLTDFAAELLEELIPAVKQFAEDNLPEIKEALEVVRNALGIVFQFIVDNWKWLSIVAAVIVTILGLISGVIAIVVPIINAIVAIAGVATALGVSMGTVAAVIGGIILYLGGFIVVIGAIIGAIIALVVYWDEVVAFIKKTLITIGEFLANLWQKILAGIEAGWNWITNLLSPISTWIYDNVIAPIINYFTELWNKIVSTFHMVIDPWIEIIKRASKIVYDSIIVPIKNYFVGLWNDIKAVFNAAATWFNGSVVQPIVKIFTNAWNTLKNGAKQAWEGIKSIFSTVATFFGNIFSAAWQKVLVVFAIGGKIFQGIKEGITTVFKTVVNHIIGGINKVIAVPFKAINNALSRIKGVEILGVKPFDWVTTFSIPSIPKLEKGGVLKRGQVGLLEGNGAEAVVPLEQNTGWLDEIAKRLGGMLGASDTPIVLQVDGKTFAQTTVSAINNLTRQQGKLTLNLR